MLLPNGNTSFGCIHPSALARGKNTWWTFLFIIAFENAFEEIDFNHLKSSNCPLEHERHHASTNLLVRTSAVALYYSVSDEIDKGIEICWASS